MKSIFASKTLWLNVAIVAYVLATNNVGALEQADLPSSLDAVVAFAANVINRFFTKDEVKLVKS